MKRMLVGTTKIQFNSGTFLLIKITHIIHSFELVMDTGYLAGLFRYENVLQ